MDEYVVELLLCKINMLSWIGVLTGLYLLIAAY